MNHAMTSFTYNKNIKRLFWTTLFGSVNFLEPIMVLFYLKRGLDASTVYWITLAWCLSVLIFEVPTGAFADRFGPKASFIAGSLLGMMSKIVLLFAHEPIMFFLFNILWGISVTFFSGAEEALIYESLKEDGQEHRMSEVMGKIQSASFYSMMVTFLLGSYLARDLAEWQFITLIIANAVIQLVELCLFFGVVNPPSFAQFRENPFHQVKGGVQTIRQTPGLVKLFLNFTIVFIASFVIFGKIEQPYLTEAGLPVSLLGVYYAAMAAMGLLVSNRIGWLQKRFANTTLMGMTGIATVLALGFANMSTLVLSDTSGSLQLITATAVFFIIRLSRMVRTPIYSQMTNDYIPSKNRATTLSLLSIGDSFFDVLFLTTFAGIATMGLPSILAGCAIACLIGVCIPLTKAH